MNGNAVMSGHRTSIKQVWKWLDDHIRATGVNYFPYKQITSLYGTRHRQDMGGIGKQREQDTRGTKEYIREKYQVVTSFPSLGKCLP